jgi:hypothetical protein
MAVPVRSDFLAYHRFPEVYHGQGITTPPFSGGERAVAGQGITLYIEEKAADGVAHVVFSCRCAL